MRNRFRHVPVRSHWPARPVSSGAFRPWLRDRGSLTQRLRARSRTFSVQGVSQQWARPQPDEARLLGMRGHHSALLREVSLCCDGQPVVFAHSVLPRRSLRGAWHDLGKLGARPLGEALFANPAVVRASLSYRKLSPHSELYQRACEDLPQRPPYLWARRSVFLLYGAPILVTEVFLPQVLQL